MNSFLSALFSLMLFLLMEVLGCGVGVVEIITSALTSARAHTHVFITFYTHSPQQQQPALTLPFPFLLWQRGAEGALIPRAPGV